MFKVYYPSKELARGYSFKEITHRRLIAGRKEGCWLEINHDSVSGQHLMFEIEVPRPGKAVPKITSEKIRKKLYITSLSPTHGTFSKDTWETGFQKVGDNERTEIKSGTRIKLGTNGPELFIVHKDHEKASDVKEAFNDWLEEIRKSTELKNRHGLYFNRKS